MIMLRQFFIVLNDSVMDNGYFSKLMRMSIFIADSTMGCPSGMSDSAGFFPSVPFTAFSQILYSSGTFENLYIRRIVGA